MKTILLLICSAAIAAAGICPLTETGSSTYGPGGKGFVDWHGFIPGTANSAYRKNITGWTVHPSSTTWLTTNASSTQGLSVQSPHYQTDGFVEPWLGQVIHYVHGNTQRRMPLGSTNLTPPYSIDPGMVPAPFKPRIANYYGPFARPQLGGTFGPYVIDPGYRLSRYSGPGDQQLTLIDIDTCIEHDFDECYDLDSGLMCHFYGAYDLLAGDLQRPINVPNVSNAASVSGVPHVFGRVGWDEWSSVSGIQHAINITAMNGLDTLSPSFTGPASFGQQIGGSGDYVTSSMGSRMPFGSRLRLKASFDPAAHSVPSDCMPMINVLKSYGGVFKDGGNSIEAWQEGGSMWPWDCNAVGGELLANPANADIVYDTSAPYHGIYCAFGWTNCPDTLPTGNPPVINSITLNGASSATLTISSSPQTVVVGWNVTGVVDVDGFPVRLRNISWGTNNRLGPGWVDGPTNGEKLQLTVCSLGSCDIQNTGTYPIQLLVHNRFGRRYTGDGTAPASPILTVQ